MQDLADKVWANATFHGAAARLQRAWLAREIGVGDQEGPTKGDVTRIVQASAILACSNTMEHRELAYRCATSAYDLYGVAELPLDQATRVVLARLSNFPAMATRRPIQDALAAMPPSLIAEELVVSDRRTVTRGSHQLLLTRYQFRLWRQLQAGKRVVMAAPTSAGKSFVLQNFLATLFERGAPHTAVYLVPTRALISQVSTDLRRLLKAEGADGTDVTIATVPIEGGEALPTQAVYVLTQERLRMMLNAHAEFAADVIIVDEAHSVGDGARGVLLQWTIDDLLQRGPQAQLMFASPTLRNLDVFGRLFGLDDIESLPSGEPTVAQNFMVVRIEDVETGGISIHNVERSRALTQLGVLELGRPLTSRIARLVSIATTFGKGASNIVYANGAGDAEQIALGIAAQLKRTPTPNRQALALLAAETVHPAYALVACVRQGVAFHYSNMPTQIRQAVEDAVANGDIDFLVCTTTLLQGVNLPAKNLFLCKPEKGDRIPLEPVDFWNLAGRAGRLMKEFQGNIFLIDYENWRGKPVDQPRDALVVPAIEAGLIQHGQELLRIVERPAGQRSENGDLEAVFGRLLDQHSAGRLALILARVPGFETGSPASAELQRAVSNAASTITLSQPVLRTSPNISPHKQQDLYRVLRERAVTSKAAAMELVPKHPRDRDAWQSYADILETCHRVVLGLPETSKLHRFLALIAVFWMQGRPLPRIIQNQLRRNPDKPSREVVRETLELVEQKVRYQCLRLFSCYGAVLAQVLRDLALEDAVKSIPSIPLYLELGASDRTTLSLMSLGLSRATATRLTPRAGNPNLDFEAARAWLKSAQVAEFGLSLLMLREVYAVLGDGASG